MLTSRSSLFSLVLAVALAAPLRGQYAITQDSTLQGLQQVYLNFQMTEDAVSAGLYSELATYLNLELRKTGIRVARMPEELGDGDGVLNVSLIEIPRTLTTDFQLRVDVEQMATLQRTGQMLRMVTWYYEDPQLNVIPENVARDMVTRGLNQFLSAWLDMNGR